MSAIILQVKVKPRARVSELTQAADGTWVAKLKAPPVDGKANMELVGLVAQKFRCRKTAVSIKAGASGRTKLVIVEESLTDQLYIKAQRIRGLQSNQERRVDEGEEPEFIGIVNYCVIALIQLEKGVAEQPDMAPEEILPLYDEAVRQTKALMEDKNHDYGEAWREMRISSLTDLILQKLLRIKQIEDNQGKTVVSEGIKANYQDILNYAVFALILLDEAAPAKQPS